MLGAGTADVAVAHAVVAQAVPESVQRGALEEPIGPPAMQNISDGGDDEQENRPENCLFHPKRPHSGTRRTLMCLCSAAAACPAWRRAGCRRPGTTF